MPAGTIRCWGLRFTALGFTASVALAVPQQAQAARQSAPATPPPFEIRETPQISLYDYASLKLLRSASATEVLRAYLLAREYERILSVKGQPKVADLLMPLRILDDSQRARSEMPLEAQQAPWFTDPSRGTLERLATFSRAVRALPNSPLHSDIHAAAQVLTGGGGFLRVREGDTTRDTNLSLSAALRLQTNLALKECTDVGSQLVSYSRQNAAFARALTEIGLNGENSILGLKLESATLADAKRVDPAFAEATRAKEATTRTGPASARSILFEKAATVSRALERQVLAVSQNLGALSLPTEQRSPDGRFEVSPPERSLKDEVEVELVAAIHYARLALAPKSSRRVIVAFQGLEQISHSLEQLNGLVATWTSGGSASPTSEMLGLSGAAAMGDIIEGAFAAAELFTPEDAKQTAFTQMAALFQKVRTLQSRFVQTWLRVDRRLAPALSRLAAIDLSLERLSARMGDTQTQIQAYFQTLEMNPFAQENALLRASIDAAVAHCTDDLTDFGAWNGCFYTLYARVKNTESVESGPNAPLRSLDIVTPPLPEWRQAVHLYLQKTASFFRAVTAHRAMRKSKEYKAIDKLVTTHLQEFRRTARSLERSASELVATDVDGKRIWSTAVSIRIGEYKTALTAFLGELRATLIDPELASPKEASLDAGDGVSDGTAIDAGSAESNTEVATDTNAESTDSAADPADAGATLSTQTRAESDSEIALAAAWARIADRYRKEMATPQSKLKELASPLQKAWDALELTLALGAGTVYGQDLELQRLLRSGEGLLTASILNETTNGTTDPRAFTLLVDHAEARVATLQNIIESRYLSKEHRARIPFFMRIELAITAALEDVSSAWNSAPTGLLPRKSKGP